VVLDLGLPNLDGLEVTRRVRSISSVPILMLTARGSESDKVLGFEIGADDYVTKPFSPREFVARCRALVRRHLGREDQKIVDAGVLRVDPMRRSAFYGEDEITLTSLEFEVLHFLASRPGRVFSRDALIEHVWRDSRNVDARTIDSLISRLRRKLDKETDGDFIQTVWGAGYRFKELS
jgi:DNA-binding response OmpR family regulator